jgi:DNA-binding MarR family transcriptional regulator
VQRRPTTDILRHYPQIYLACHLEHTRSRTNRFQLTDKDVVLLGHLDEEVSLSAGRLARHLGINASTLSAAVQRLEKLGHLSRQADAHDRRRIGLRLTSQGAEALAATSILDPGRVTALLMQLTPAERKRAIDGLALLARAARKLQSKYPKRRSS